MKNKNKIVFICISVVNVIIVTLLLSYALYVFRMQVKLSHYSLTQGEVYSSRQNYSGEVYAVGNTPQPEFRTEKEYEYYVNGVQYIGKPNIGTFETGETGKINIYYDPTNPADFSLTRDMNVSPFPLIGFAVGCIIANIVYFVVNQIKDKA